MEKSVTAHLLNYEQQAFLEISRIAFDEFKNKVIVWNSLIYHIKMNYDSKKWG